MHQSKRQALYSDQNTTEKAYTEKYFNAEYAGKKERKKERKKKQTNWDIYTYNKVQQIQ